MTDRVSTTIMIVLASLATILGCHDPSLEVAREAAHRQAEQNDQMARVTSEAAAGARRLVEEHGRARREMANARRDLQGERTRLSDGWNDLEKERQAIARARRTDSALAAMVEGGGAVLAAIFALGLAWLTLFGLSRQDDAAEGVCTLLIAELVDGPPRLTRETPIAGQPHACPQQDALRLTSDDQLS